MDIASRGRHEVPVTVPIEGTLATGGSVTRGDQGPIDRTLRVVGNRAALLLLREAFCGATRFGQMLERSGVARAVAAQRLRELVAAGVLEKKPYRDPGQRTRHEYALTPSGHDLMPVVVGLLHWGATHAPGASDPVVTHAGCSAAAWAVVRCAAGHDLDASDLLIAGTCSGS